MATAAQGTRFPAAPLVDQHSNGVLHTELGLATFETHLATALGARIPAHGTFYDTRAGLALRRWCPPLLGLEPHCPPARYLARRRQLGAYASARALLRGSGIGWFLVESAHPAPETGTRGLTSPAELASLCDTDAPVRESVRLEALAAQVADTSGSVRSFVANTAEALHGAARGAALFACEAAFREGEPPGVGEVHRAASRWFRARALSRAAPRGEPIPGGGLREEPTLVRHLVWSALVTGRPLQLHCGDPAPLRAFLGAAEGVGAPVVLLPRVPHHAAAARFAAAFPHVYADVGPDPGVTLGEAPFAKLLFSTRAHALPELYVLRARAFTGALGRLLETWTADGVCSRTDAARIAGYLGHGNARRLYRLDAGEEAGGVGAGSS